MRKWPVILPLVACLMFGQVSTAVADPTVRVFVGQQEIKVDVPPYVDQGTTMVSLRELSQSLGFTVSWDGHVVLTRGKVTVELWPGTKRVRVNGQEGTLSVAPVVVNGRTMVPARFIAETLGAQVTWDGPNHIVRVIPVDATGQGAVGAGTVDPAALALLQQAQAAMAKNPSLMVNGHLDFAVHMSGSSLSSMDMTMPFDLSMQTYNHDLLMTMQATSPMGSFSMQMAMKDGNLYMKSDNAPWAFVSETDKLPAGATALNPASMAGLTPLMQGFDIHSAGQETVNGVLLERIDMAVKPELLTQLLGGLTSGGGSSSLSTPAGLIQKFTMSAWIDPKTAFLSKITLAAGGSMPDPNSGATITFNLTGQITLAPSDKPIVFPDLPAPTKPTPAPKQTTPAQTPTTPAQTPTVPGAGSGKTLLPS